MPRLVFSNQEKSRTLQHQLDAALFSKRQKVQKSSAPIMINLDSDSVTDAIDSAGKPSTQEPLSTKAGNRVVPAYRRAKVRGAILEDSGDDEGIM
ncbi:hypothetical protein GIB67_029767 [Kingdonia uniflora]|uniref:Uncharacterized protein n=1 Tax=Kingdonia uniflora TaxID=39325 RepID=A0A7J7NIT3_9MAGN|nr:hypothetical protein GIB67_029767 [Kingdonia uniflora]